MNTVVLDIETKLTFDEVGGRDKMEALGISLIGVYDYQTKKYTGYEEKEIEVIEKRLSQKPLVIGFNIKKFDMRVIRPYLHFDPFVLPMLDIMEEIQNVVGHRVSLQSVAQATIGTGKSGDGLDAIRYYRNNEIEKLKKYCLDDVRITKEVYEYGCKNKEVFFTSKYSTGKTRVKVAWEMSTKEETAGEQLGLF